MQKWWGDRHVLLRHPAVMVGGVGIAGSTAPVSPWLALLVACLWVVVSGARVKLALVATLVFAVTGTRSLAREEQYRATHGRTTLRLEEPRRCFGRVEVIRSPIVRTSPTNERVAIWSARASSLDCEGRSFGPLRLRLTGGPVDLARGDRVEVTAQLAPVRLFRNAAVQSPWQFAARRGAVLSGRVLFVDLLAPGEGWAAAIDRQRARVRARIALMFKGPVVGLAKALVLGENDLAEEDAEAFADSGLLHLLAVSGTHLVIAVLFLVSLLRAFLVRLRWLARRFDVARVSAGLGAGASLLYADFSGGSGSAWRAAFMLCGVLGARAWGYRLGGAAALGVSLIVGVAVDPLAGSDLSFLLSALATAGLIGLGQPLCRILSRGWLARPPFSYLLASFVATLVSTLPCAPVLALMDGEMTWAALFANVVAAPIGELIALPACLAHAVAQPWPDLERGLATLGSGALIAVRFVALYSASVESAQFHVPFPSADDVAFVVALALCWSWIVGSARKAMVRSAFTTSLRVSKTGRLGVLVYSLAVVACVGLVRLVDSAAAAADASSRKGRAVSEKRLSITALDVGQGDALLLEFPNGQVGLVDGGGFALGFPDVAKRVVLPVFRAREIQRLDLMVLTHAHPDHLSGLVGVAKALPVAEFWHPTSQGSSNSDYQELLQVLSRAPTRILESRELCSEGARQFGGTKVSVLWPCDLDDAEPAEARLGLNDRSLVLSIAHGKHRALLTGDLEAAGERALLEAVRAARTDGALEAELLKVAHHGSDTSSTVPFLEAVRPQVALLSSGVRNRFGHPESTTLERLQEREIAAFRTDRCGAVTWLSDGREQTLRVTDPCGLAPADTGTLAAAP